jgi:endo-alpha-1,4-polygalactosaminidase (GH114 family)
MAAVRGTQHPTDTSLISATSNVNTSSYIQDNGCDIGTQGFGYWYTASDALAIRMNFGNVSSVKQELNSRFNIYPNPSNGIFTIENNNQKDINYSIRNVLGQITFRGKINTASNSTVDLSHLNSAIYTIEYDGDNQLFNQKLIIK